MRQKLFTLMCGISLCSTTTSMAQFKLQYDGKIGMGTLNPRYDIDLITKGDSNDTIMIGKEYHGNKLMIEMEYALPNSLGRTGYSSLKVKPLCYSYNSSLGTSSYRWGGLYLMNNPNVVSDERLKENIQRMEDGYLAKVLQINPISYTMKDSLFGYKLLEKDAKKVHAGFSAQEIEKVFPNVVDCEDSIYSIQYAALIPYLVQAIKEQQKEIIEQKIEIENLKKEINYSREVITESSEKAILRQNTPNPFTNSTTVGVYIPQNIINAKICIYDLYGTQIKSYSIEERGESSIVITNDELKSGIYYYALLCDKNIIDSKQMIIE